MKKPAKKPAIITQYQYSNSFGVRIIIDFSFRIILKSLVDSSLMVCGRPVKIKDSIVIQALGALGFAKLVARLQRKQFKRPVHRQIVK